MQNREFRNQKSKYDADRRISFQGLFPSFSVLDSLYCILHSIIALCLIFVGHGDAAATETATEKASPTISIEQEDDGATVKIDGQLFTRYLTRSGTKPILWPVMGPTGQPITRAYPVNMDLGPNEKKDHVHHRSLWFTHGNVNGLSFWHETGKHGKVVHRGFEKIESGAPGIIVTRNDWIDADGNKVLEDQRTVRFNADKDNRWIDFDVTLTASDKAVEFGDTKEGSFGMRVAGTMKVDAGLGGKIVNSEGHTDKQAWGKAAAWVDYHGPVDGKTVGITIMNHPSSFRHPTYWHVRNYGLFAANPFGLHDFTAGKLQGSYTLPAGKSITLRYRIFLHRGDHVAGKVAAAYDRYANVAPED